MDDTIAWLLSGDPSVRWQAERDLLGANADEVDSHRAMVATTGWGKRLLDVQDADGRWGGGLYSPKWISTTYTLLLLERLGLEDGHPAAARGTELLLDGVLPNGGVSFWVSHPEGEACVTAMVGKLAARFTPGDDRISQVLGHLGARRMNDGGWNCEDHRGATHSSLHTTISVLEAVHAARRAGHPGLESMLESGSEFLLAHHLYRSHRTGEVIRPDFTRFSFPPRWFYDVMRGLEHFASTDAVRDPRAEDAVELLISKRRKDGRWPVQNRHSGKVWFDMEKTGGPSRWNTLRALRILQWWEPGTH